jgi:hypothetical protein
MSTTDKNYLEKLFINEAKPALKRHSGGGGEPCPSIVIITGTIPYSPPTVMTDKGHVIEIPECYINGNACDATSYALYEKVDSYFTIEGPNLNMWYPERNKNVEVTLLDSYPDPDTDGFRTYNVYQVTCTAFPAILDIATAD